MSAAAGPERDPDSARVRAIAGVPLPPPPLLHHYSHPRPASIRIIPDFPKPGIAFQDITTLLLHPAAYALVVQSLVERFRAARLDAVACFEARGFFFGPPVARGRQPARNGSRRAPPHALSPHSLTHTAQALALGLPLVPLRKPRKLPGAVLSESYSLEYGTDSLEMHADALRPGDRVLLVDDLMATGGTAAAGVRLLRRAGAVPAAFAAVLSLPALGGGARLAALEPQLEQYVVLEVDEAAPAPVAA